jgi:hypothetical protein
VPFEAGGPNASHPEFLLTAFARDVVVADHTTSTVVKGSSDAFLARLLEDSSYARSVAFRMHQGKFVPVVARA